MASSIAYTPRVSTATFHRPSSQQTQNSGASYQLILEHILSYTGTYEIPLQTMYTINSTPNDTLAKTPQGQQQQRHQEYSKHQHQRSCSSSGSRIFPSSPTSSPYTNQQEATAQFTSSLIYHIATLPSQPCSLSPPLLTTFLYRCFPRDLNLVDFPQSLTALDYLKDLETRRRRELQAALKRLGIEREALSENLDDVCQRFPGLVTWVKGIESSERKVSALYTQLYVAVRRWILINELNLEPFNKHNCIAMLNTLYPPTAIATTPQPTPALTAEVMKNQREGFFKYIQAVEKRGVEILGPLMAQGKKPSDENGWASVHRTLDSYLRVSNSLIDECASIANASSFEILRDPPSFSLRRGKKMDSGISFGSYGASSRSSNLSAKVKSPLPSPPAAPSPPPDPFESKGLSTLEKIAKEIRKIKFLHRADTLEEQAKRFPSPPAGRPGSSDSPGDWSDRSNVRRNRSIRKLRSLSDFRGRNRSSTSLVAGLPDDAPEFDKEEMKRERLLYEAKMRAAQG